jgi:hypothetical protein
MKSVQVVDFLMLVILGLAVAVVLLYLTGCDAEEEEEPYFDTDIFWENEKDTGTGETMCKAEHLGIDEWAYCACSGAIGEGCWLSSLKPIKYIQECTDQGRICCCEPWPW